MEKGVHRPGFTLPMVLVAMAGLLVLLAGLMVMVGLERQSARAHADGYRAELAARSGLAEVGTLLREFSANDEYVVFRAPSKVAHDDNGNGFLESTEDVERPYHFLAHVERKEGGSEVSYEPLFSTGEEIGDSAVLEVPDGIGLPEGEDERTSLWALRWEDAPVLAWHYIEDSEGRKVARYAYWTEDMEAYLEASAAGNDRGGKTHARANELWAGGWPSTWPMNYPGVDSRYMPPWPAPGLNPGAVDDEPGLDQAGVWTLADPAARGDQTDFDDRIREVREYAVTGESLLAAMEVPAPLARDVDGRLVDPEGRVLEENMAAGNIPYEEQALIPFVEGIAEEMVGEPQLNLNRLLEQNRGAAVSEMAAHVREVLPDFGAARKGGFPEDYEETLAANALDYADEDSDATVSENRYRGFDSYPLVNEFLATVTWQWRQHPDDSDNASPAPMVGKSFHRQNGRLYILFTVELFAELWNMSSQPTEGEISMNYDFAFSFPYGSVLSPPGVAFMDEGVLDRPVESIDPKAGQSGTRHNLEKDGGRYYFPPERISLDGNDHRLIRLGAVRYMFDVGPAFLFLPGVIGSMEQEDEATSEYRLRWNGTLVDWSRGKLERSRIDNVRSGGKAYTRGNVCGTYGLYNEFFTGMGDVRHTFYGNEAVSENSYPQNYSPNRRNVRYGSIYRNNPEAIYGRVIPSEWPDGGHDASFDLQTFHKAGRGEADRRRRPDDGQFLDPRPAPEPGKAPVRISNFGRFFSETELGHVTDPLMWSEPGSGRTVELWAPELKAGVVKSSRALGGGNTLRIGRPEHELFSRPGDRRPAVEAARLLDLFHCGMPFSEDRDEREGDLVWREGHVNINTAPRDVIRAMVAGELAADSSIGREGKSHDTRFRAAPEVKPETMSPPRIDAEADVIADAIVARRPFASVSELASVEDPEGRPVLGNLRLYPQGEELQLSDSALEEVFARLYNSATVRSRNFRVHVVGEAIREMPSGIKVLAKRRKVYQVFSNPGDRGPDGAIDKDKLKVELIHERSS